MKTVSFIILFVILFYRISIAQPQAINYQGVARNSLGLPLNNQLINIRLSVLDSTSTGQAVFVETHSTTTNISGLFNLSIGLGNVVSGTFASVPWGQGDKWLKVEMDTAGGNNYSLIGTTQFLSVPFAMYSKNASTASGGGNFTHYIGEQFGGGVIFYLWKDNSGLEHGLIAATTDQSTVAAWSNVINIYIGAMAQSSWDGLSNSNAILGQAGHTTSSAKLCLDLVSNGQSDWYLPSIDELSFLWHNRFIINKTLSTIVGATVLPNSAYFWSSTEDGAGTAWIFAFRSGDAYATTNSKNDVNYVRAVRAF